MNNKRLHIHSLPLVLFALTLTIIAIISANAWRLSPATQALLRPGLRLESTDHGYVKVTTNRHLADETAGAYVELPSQENSVMSASQAIDSIGLQMSLDQAVAKHSR